MCSILSARQLLLPLVAFALAVTLGCSGKKKAAPRVDDAAAEVPGPKTASPDASAKNRSVAVPWDRRLQPVFSIAVNGAAQARAFRGAPLLVRAVVIHPDAYVRGGQVEPMVLAAREGPWSGAIRIVIMDERGKAVDWPFHLARPPAGPLALDAKTSGQLTWWLAPEETARLPAGNYQLYAVLDTTAAPAAGWKGAIRSETLTITFDEEPTALTEAQFAQKYFLLAQLAQLRGDMKQALAHLESLLAEQPKSAGGLAFKGDLLAADGRIGEALKIYDLAIDAYYGRGTEKLHPPTELLAKQRKLSRSLAKQP